LFQNPVGFEQALGKTSQKPGFSTKSKEAVPKTEVLEQPQFVQDNKMIMEAAHEAEGLCRYKL
jgi:hypothetical protein